MHYYMYSKNRTIKSSTRRHQLSKLGKNIPFIFKVFWGKTREEVTACDVILKIEYRKKYT